MNMKPEQILPSSQRRHCSEKIGTNFRNLRIHFPLVWVLWSSRDTILQMSTQLVSLGVCKIVASTGYFVNAIATFFTSFDQRLLNWMWNRPLKYDRYDWYQCVIMTNRWRLLTIWFLGRKLWVPWYYMTKITNQFVDNRQFGTSYLGLHRKKYLIPINVSSHKICLGHLESMKHCFLAICGLCSFIYLAG